MQSRTVVPYLNARFYKYRPSKFWALLVWPVLSAEANALWELMAGSHGRKAKVCVVCVLLPDSLYILDCSPVPFFVCLLFQIKTLKRKQFCLMSAFRPTSLCSCILACLAILFLVY